MEYHELKNFGQLFNGKASARVMMASFTAVPKELGFIGTPKFLTKLQGKETHWKKYRFKTVKEYGITDQDFLGGVRYSLAFYTALLAGCGREKTERSYPNLAEKLSLMMNEEFFPAPEDFLKCPDPWEALREYFLAFFGAWDREGICRFQVVKNTDSEFHVQLGHCAFDAMHREAGCPEAMAMASQADETFFPRLARGIGAEFRRDGWLCRGDSVCDWQFLRRDSSD